MWDKYWCPDMCMAMTDSDIVLGQIRRLRDAGFCLPSATTVAEERKFGVSQSGWSREIVQEMKAAFNVEKPSQGRHGIISFDEVKIKEGVVQDPHTGRLIGA